MCRGEGILADEEWQLFRLWLGATEYLFRQPELLDECIRFALDDDTFRSDDLEFTIAARVRVMVQRWWGCLLTSNRIGRMR